MGKVSFIFDGDCGFCMRSVEWLKRRGAADSLDFQSYQSAPPAMARAGLSPEDCQQAAYVVEEVDGMVKAHRGAAAMNYALRKLPGPSRAGWRLLGRLYLLPVIRQVENLGYAWIARHRHRLGRDEDHCTVPGSDGSSQPPKTKKTSSE